MTKTVSKQPFFTFTDWSEFQQKLENVASFENEQQLCELVGIDFDMYQKITQNAVWSWKESPSRSFFNAIARTGLTFPKEHDLIFDNHLEQVLFVELLDTARVTTKGFFDSVYDENGDKVMVKGYRAVQYPSGMYRERTIKKVNDVLQILFLYRHYQRHKLMLTTKKIPKKLYRGIRFHDLLDISAINKVLDRVDTKDLNYRKSIELRLDELLKYLEDKTVDITTDFSLLSFTASKSIASYFTGGNGLILEVDTKDLSNDLIFTSELQDSRFDEHDYVSHKKEREYILDIRSKKIKISNIYVNHLDYFIQKNNPLAVTLFDHDDKEATYELNGVRIKAYFVWTSNTTHSIRYRNLDEKDIFGKSSREFKSAYGFNPQITEKNLKDIKNFQVEIKR